MKFAVAMSAVMLALGPAAHAAETISVKGMAASNKVRATAKTERTTTSTTSVLVKEFFMPLGGTARLSMQMKSDGANSVFVAVVANFYQGTTCSNSTPSATYAAFSCDLQVSAGTFLQIYLRSDTGQTVAIRNVRVMFDIVNVTEPVLVEVD